MVQRYTFSVKYKKKLVIFEEKLYFCNRKGVIMDKKYISFSKLLSRRILMISIATFAVIALLMTVGRNLFRAYASDGSTPDSIVARMDKDLRRGNDACMFITFFVGDTEQSDDLTMLCIRLM